MENNTVKQPADLIHFVIGLSISPDGTVSINRLSNDSGASFVSDYYTPTFTVSPLAKKTNDFLKFAKNEGTKLQIPDNTITKQLKESNLKVKSLDAYILAQIVVLESFSIVHHTTHNPEYLRYITKKDIVRIKENINFITDYLGTEEEFYHLIPYFRNTYIALGYIENQIDVIRNSRAVR